MSRSAKQLTPRQVANRANGKKGGQARARKLSSEQRKKIAASGGKTTSLLYGSEFYSFIDKKRKHVGRYRTPVDGNQNKNAKKESGRVSSSAR